MESDKLYNPVVEFIYSPVVNFAIQQNKIPVIRKLVLTNKSDFDWAEIVVGITPEPSFATPWQQNIEMLQAGQSFDLGTVSFQVSAQYLAEMTEKITGSLALTISKNGTILYTKLYPIDILAFDFWNGTGILPEVIASFVTPNHPEISKVIVNAASILNRWTGNPSFDGYQSQNPDRVKKQMAAIFEAIASLGIVYSAPPSSFEEQGQRIRLCDTVFSQKLATCVDMALLFAACIESVGLNPIVIITKGHAFAGAWLIDNTFSDSVNDDPSLLTKRTATGINEIVLVETTYMNAGRNQSFDEAMFAANTKMAYPDDFVQFTDIRRARFSGIKPLPQRVKTTTGWEIIDVEKQERTGLAPDDIISDLQIPATPTAELTKQKLWERKLLDLSLRNNLLNLRITKNTVQVIAESLNLLEDALSEGSEFQILPKPGEWENPNTISGIFQNLQQKKPNSEFLQHELAHNRLRSYMSETELANSLTGLYRTSRLSLEENGANTLYLAMGVLKWFETPKSQLPRFAPILLLPVEIIRKSAAKGYVIRSREEDPLLNITLLEMLRQDFGIIISDLTNLPTDEKGLDVRLIFNIFRKGIMSQKNWDIEEQAFLSTFSFNKFILWNDIHSNVAKLQENKIVSSLISGKIEWNVKDILKEVPDFDSTFSPSEIALPISADATQLEAIITAAKDQSFILHGPPGTGKSQTITNIIANALFQGKRVLFVAEKMAALSVVQKRLENIGLAPFCLELHSNKSKKSVVLDQLQRTTEAVNKTSPKDFSTEANRLHILRTELNSYVNALHKVYPSGLTLYDAFSGYARLSKSPDIADIDQRLVENLTEDKLNNWTELIKDLQVAGSLCGHPFRHPLTSITTKNYSQQIKANALELIQKYIDELKEIHSRWVEICNVLNIESADFTYRKFESAAALLGELTRLPDTPPAMIATENAVQVMDHITGVAAHGIKRDRFRNEILEDFDHSILGINAVQKLNAWNIASEKWFLPRWFEQNKVAKSFNPFLKSGKIEKSQVFHWLTTLIDFQKEQAVLDNNSAQLSSLLGFLWKNGNCDWSLVNRLCVSIKNIHNAALVLADDVLKTKQLRNNLAEGLSEGTSTFLAIKGVVLKSFLQHHQEITGIQQKLSVMLGVSFVNDQNDTSDWIKTRETRATEWLNNMELLRDWTNWNLVKEKAMITGLTTVVESYESGKLKNEEVVPAFTKTLFRQTAEFITQREPVLSSFNGKVFESKIEKFKEKSAYFEELTKAELYARLASKIPSFTLEAAQSSEIGILQKAIRNRGRAMPLRKLFDSIPNLLPRMCPCMLMSPISVAQYIDIENPKFDLVIFDEASQMPTSESVGAIARGKNLIVVGDPMQMPPTNFFSTNYFDEENYEKEDLESILDDCLAISIPSKYLLWHYRSKHESLIAFSNYTYYDNKLLTFPSPDDITSKVTNIYVPGYYDRGKTRQNDSEARAIVEEVMRRLANPVLRKRSIGIVAFSIVQQILIEDLLNEAYKKHPDLEIFALESTEPVFIKNLENVQGDERDIILFSMGYGPDKDGKVSLNFGPLNREGGWRRLNVAVSRARYEMKVFSTLRADQIDITRTSSEGVAGVKAFLMYSEKGKIALPQPALLKKTNPHSFETSVANEILKLGYVVHTDIGCSGYRINLGVVNPEKPSEYMLGILTDGHNYRAAKTAREREIVQMEVLRTLGWNIFKIWSPDWYDNSEKVVQEIVQALKEAQKKSVILPETPKVQVSTVSDEPKGKPVNLKLQGFFQPVAKPVVKHNYYKICQPDVLPLSGTDDFFNPGNERKIQHLIKQVIKTEAPICQSLLTRRVLSACGISRPGSRINQHINNLLLNLALQETTQNNVSFFWKEDQNPENYTLFRIPENDAQKRMPEELPLQEIAWAIVETLTRQLSLPANDLIKETAKLFGYARMGTNVELAMKNGIRFAQHKNLIFEKNWRYLLKEK